MEYVRLSDAVDQLSVARRDDARQEYLRYLILAKDIMRDLKIIFLNDFRRKYLPINKDTNTVRLPFDLYRYRTISVIENCKDRWGHSTERTIPLTYNPYINITPQEPITCDNDCNCEINHPVCQELANYEVIEETVTDGNLSPEFSGTRQIILRTCENGDIIKETSEPVQKWIQGDEVCDYEIEMLFLGEAIDFPYTILSYTVNGEPISESPDIEIANQAEQDAFFTGLGFTKESNTKYTIEDSTDIYFSIRIEDQNSPANTFNINFVQSNCHRLMINDGFENQLVTEVLCNVELKDCGCIREDESNINTIVSCCGDFLNCCQEGKLNNWSGWGVVPPCCQTNSEQPFNSFGSFNYDRSTQTLYLDSVNASRVLVAYDSDGCEGDIALPDYTIPPLMAGIAWKGAQYDEAVTSLRRGELERNYNKEINHMLINYTDPIYMADLVNALKTRKTPY